MAYGASFFFSAHTTGLGIFGVSARPGWDALIVHAASKGGASVLLTEDVNAEQVIEGVRIVNPLIDPAVLDE